MNNYQECEMGMTQRFSSSGIDVRLDLSAERKLSTEEYDRMGKIILKTMDELKEALGQNQ